MEVETIIKAQSSAWFLVEELKKMKKHSRESRILANGHFDAASKISIALNELIYFMGLEAQKPSCPDCENENQSELKWIDRKKRVECQICGAQYETALYTNN